MSKKSAEKRLTDMKKANVADVDDYYVTGLGEIKCRYCTITILNKTDNLKGHLTTKTHKTTKQEKMLAAQRAG